MFPTSSPTGSARSGSWACGPTAFLLLYCLGTALLFQRPLYSFAVSTLRPFDAGAALTLSTLFVLQFVLSFGSLALVALVSMRLAKAVCVALLLCNAVALHFMDAYGAVLDRTMMGNVFNTNTAEAAQLAQPGLLLYVLFYAVLPSLVIFRTRIGRGRRQVAAAFVIACTLGTGWIYANAKSWLWLDHNFSRLGGLMLPWSYVINSVRYQQGVMLAARVDTLLPPAHVTDPARTVVVLVIGESARAANFSLYGYARQTNPLLAASGAVALRNAHACATYTTESVQCMLSHLGSKTPLGARFEPLPSYLQRQGVHVTWRSNNSGEPPLKVASYEKAADIRAACHDADCARLDTDEVLLEGLEQKLRDAGRAKQLVVLHQTGSHGPLYSTKYPARFEVFKPVCSTVDLKKCNGDQLLNAYDNTIVYTDYLLGRVITMLKSLDDTEAVMIYVSDHGESLGEYGLYLHGTPYAMAPDVQKDIPFIVWMSDAFVRQRHLAGVTIGATAPHTHDAVFHSIMGALGLDSDIYDKRLDIFQPPPGSAK